MTKEGPTLTLARLERDEMSLSLVCLWELVLWAAILFSFTKAHL